MRWIIAGLVILALVAAARFLPVAHWIALLSGWIQELGPWGPVIYAAIYVLAVVCFAPGSVLTLGAGAVFGVLVGVVTVSVASTLGAAAAFLIARYLARPTVEAQARRHPRFHAVDEAIRIGGWKIVALLRLSPAVPYNLANYLFGLTAVRFWPYVLASWIAMLPGTLLYVYLGAAGRAGLEAAAREDAARTPLEWALLGLGLLATAVVTVYLTRLARRQLRKVDEQRKRHSPEETLTASGDVALSEKAAPSSRRRVTVALVVLAVVMLAAGTAYWKRDALMRLFGPPVVTLQEEYAERPGGPTFDHSLLDALVKEHVTGDLMVDYPALMRDQARLDEYLAQLAEAPFEELGRSEKLALLINAYNAFTLKLILDFWPVDSIKDIPAARRWEDQRWQVGPLTLSLDEIEHEYLRPRFREPRIHFAINCAAIGCPPLRREAYVAERIDEQLEEQAVYVHAQERWFRLEPESKRVHLTQIYRWFSGDFEQVAGSVLAYVQRYAPDLAQHPEEEWTIRWLEYDWSLNSAQLNSSAFAP